MSSYSINSHPTTEPLELEETKLFLRVDDTIDDDLISALIKSSRIWVENYTWRPLITQSWYLNLDFGEVTKYIGISKAPVQVINSIVYTDIYGNSQTMSTGVDYQTDVLSEPARVKLINIPSVNDQMNAMRILFTCGYGVSQSVPEDIKSAMLLIIGHWYEHRESVSIGNFTEVPMTAESLLLPYKNTWFYPFL